MSYTLGEAAKATGKSKPTIQRAIKSGKITAIKKDDGSYSIEPSELHRVYPLKQGDSNSEPKVKQSVTPNINGELQVELDALRKELESTAQERERERELMEQQIELYKERLARADKDKDQLTALLTNQNHEEKPKRGFWARLLGWVRNADKAAFPSVGNEKTWEGKRARIGYFLTEPTAIAINHEATPTPNARSSAETIEPPKLPPFSTEIAK